MAARALCGIRVCGLASDTSGRAHPSDATPRPREPRPRSPAWCFLSFQLCSRFPFQITGTRHSEASGLHEQAPSATFKCKDTTRSSSNTEARRCGRLRTISFAGSASCAYPAVISNARASGSSFLRWRHPEDRADSRDLVERHRTVLPLLRGSLPTRRYPFRNVSTVTFGGHKNRTGGVIIPNPQFVYTCIAPTRFKPV